MQTRAIYPGTFDPITNGHLDVIRRAAKLFPEVVVAVAGNSSKRNVFSQQQRIQLVETAVADIALVQVIGFEGLLVNFMQKIGSCIIIRGLRAVSDFEYELQLAGINRQLWPEIETVFLTPAEQYMFISSTLVREIANLGGDITKFVPQCVVWAFQSI